MGKCPPPHKRGGGLAKILDAWPGGGFLKSGPKPGWPKIVAGGAGSEQTLTLGVPGSVGPASAGGRDLSELPRGLGGQPAHGTGLGAPSQPSCWLRGFDGIREVGELCEWYGGGGNFSAYKIRTEILVA